MSVAVIITAYYKVGANFTFGTGTAKKWRAIINKRNLLRFVLLAIIAIGSVDFWTNEPIIEKGNPIAFTIAPGSSLRSVSQQIADAGVPVNPMLLTAYARLSGKGDKLKAGHYELKPGTSPRELIDQLARGEFAQEGLSVIEGWTFRQMRQAVNNHPGLKHDTAQMTDQQLLASLTTEYSHPEGLFFPDTYRFAKGSSDLQIFKTAHTLLLKRLNEAWEKRDRSVPYKSPYEALTMASIVEKETGQRGDRPLIAGVFVNRLHLGMMLQTDPSVIYGMGEEYQGNIRKKDLQKDTPYNTYTRGGLPPTPIALPGMESINAALNPAKTDALYFVSKGNGSSHFSSNLNDHNRAVNQYQRNNAAVGAR